jgi:hypothetical protein
MAGKIIVPILSAFSSKGVDDAGRSIKALGASMKDMAGGIGSGVGGGLGGLSTGNFMEEAINQARDLQRGMIAVETIFGDASAAVEKFIENANKIGLSQVDAAKSITFLGSVLKQAGFEMGEVSEESKRLTTLGSDLAATYGYDVSEALVAMTALFRGEYDPIEKFGVAMKQAEVNAVLTAKKLNHLTGVELLQAQMVARMELLYSRAGDAMGAFGRQSDNLFAQQAKLNGALKDTQAAFGQPLLKPVANFIAFFREAMPSIQKAWQPVFNILGKSLQMLFAPMGKILGEIITMVGNLMQPVADVMYYLFTTIAPLFYGLWAMIQPVFDIIIKALGAVGTIVKMILMPIKIVAILIGLLMKKLGDLFNWMFGPAGSMFDWFTKTFGEGVDGIDAKLNELIEQIYGFKLESEAWEWDFEVDLTIPKPDPKSVDNGMFDWIRAIRAALQNIFPATFVQRELGKFESAVVESFKKITDLVQEGLDKNFITKKAAAAFTDYANTVKTELAQIGRERDNLLKKYSLGKALIADTKAAVIGFGNLSSLLSDSAGEITKTVTYMVGKFQTTLTSTVKGVASAADIIGKFRDILSKTKDFAKNLEALRAMNISSELYQQILGGGIEQGAAVAEALVQGGQAAVNELNGLFGDLSSTGAAMGEEAAQVMYGAGLDLSKGLVEGILQADSELVKAAKTLAKSFKTAFMDGIVGVAGTNKSFLAPLVDMMFGEAAIGSAYDNPGSQTNINVTVNAGIGADGVAVGRSIVKVLKDYERINGTSWRAGIA